jgi:AcrR family transcriptional regulator
MPRIADPHAREALLTAARRELVRHGIQRARVEDITHACGLSKGAFYLHFPSKEALVRELVGDLKTRFDAIHEARLLATTRRFGGARSLAKVRARLKDPAERDALAAQEAAFDREALQLLWEWRDLIDVLMRSSQGTEFETALWDVIDRALERVQQVLEMMAEVGVVGPGAPAEVVSAMVVGTWLVLARQMARRDQPPDFDLWVSALQRLLGPGLAPAASSPPPAGRRPRRRTAGGSARRSKRRSTS